VIEAVRDAPRRWRRPPDALFGCQSVDQSSCIVVDCIQRRLERADIGVPVHRYPS
jgi:hypothetical protein